MKAIMMSIRPQYVANILNGIKTIEIRKKFPKDYVGWVYIYCTKDKKKHLYPVALLDKNNKVFKRGYKEDDIDNRANYLNGKVIARFWCDKVEEIEDCFTMGHINNEFPDTYEIGDIQEEQLLKECCLTKEEMNAYYKGVKEPLKAIHITKLEIFDKPKEISEFVPYNIKQDHYKPFPTCDFRLTHAPQSWCWIEI